MGKQKTAIRAGALIDDAKKWGSMDWNYARRQVRRLQVRIAKAVKENRWNKVKSLQYLISRSFYAKLLAVKRVTSTRGKIPLVLTAFSGKAPEPNCWRLCRPVNYGPLMPFRRLNSRAAPQGLPSERLEPCDGEFFQGDRTTYHVRFLGGKGAERPLTYPVFRRINND